MEQGDGDVRLGLFHIGQNRGDLLAVHALVDAVVILVKHIDAVLAAHGQGHTVHTLGEGHKGDLNAAYHTDGEALVLLEGGVGGVCAQRLHTGQPHAVQGAGEACKTTADGVGVGQLHQVHAGLLQGRCHRGGGGGGAAVRLAVEGAFKVHRGDVRLRQNVRHIQKCVGVQVRAAAGGYRGIVDIEVTHRSVVNSGSGRDRGFCVLGVGGYAFGALGDIHNGILIVRRPLGQRQNQNAADDHNCACDAQTDEHFFVLLLLAQSFFGLFLPQTASVLRVR